MPLINVTSLADPRLAHYAQLQQTNLTRGSGLFVAEGEKVALRLITSDYEVASLLVEQTWAEQFASRVPPETPVYVITRELVRQLVGFAFHRGALACGRRKPAPPLPAILPARDQAALLLVCPAVQDPTNLGSIIRSAAALGASAILLGKECADPFSRRVLRVSMGAALYLPIRESTDLAADLASLRDEFAYDVVATVLDRGATPLANVIRPQRTALVLGSEGHGLDERWLELCSQRVTLPMQAGIDSLNVAVAAAVFLYHFASAGCAAKDGRSETAPLE